jgi:phosphate transport system permease protein
MTEQPATFTGRRRRRASGRVRAGDALARAVITLGGIGTIGAVLLVGLFLVAVAAPLFRPASARLERILPAGEDGPARAALPEAAGLAALGTDEAGAVAWLLPATAAGEVSGDLQLVALADGRTVQTLPAAAAGLAGGTVVRVIPGGTAAAVGFADGSFGVGRLGLETVYVDPDELPPEARTLAPGTAAATDNAAIIRGLNGHYARVSLVAEFEPAAGGAGSPVIDIDLAIDSAGMLSSGTLVAALDATGRVRLERVSRHWNLLTDEHVTSSFGGTIEPTAGFEPRFVRVAELGDQLFLVAADGRGRRYDIRDLEIPVARESFRVTGSARGRETIRVTAVERLFGGTALAIGDAQGGLRVLFVSRSPAATAADGLATLVAREFPGADGPGGGVRALAASPRSRLFAAADASGRIRLLQSTAARRVAEVAAAVPPTGQVQLAIAAREHRLLAAGPEGLAAFSIDPGSPEITLRTLLGPTWYENYPGPVHAWATTGHESFEPKFGLVPLIFGTLKATLYSMLFATPIAILAAIYASQFMQPAWKARIKPTIEMMASLPSVVLGFIAGLVFAPLLERILMPVLTGLFVVPLVLVAAAHLWQLLPDATRLRLAGWRFAVVAAVALPAGLAASRAAAPLVERLLFGGDVRSWLDGSGGGFGGWVVATLPVAALAAAWLVGRVVSPWLRATAADWSRSRAALAALVVFAGGVVLAVGLAVAAAVFLDAIRLETRGGLFGTYVQRNALVVAVGMSFAIIPLVFTIADDALASVPEHLRSASLGAGATPWQTAVRVIVPAAASGLFSAVMIGLGRAVGETMIVLMAAGNTPLVSWNLFNGFQTLSAAIATELPEAARGSTHYRVLFLAALALFAITFVVNTAAELVRQRFRRRSHEL